MSSLTTGRSLLSQVSTLFIKKQKIHQGDDMDKENWKEKMTGRGSQWRWEPWGTLETLPALLIKLNLRTGVDIEEHLSKLFGNHDK